MSRQATDHPQDRLRIVSGPQKGRVIDLSSSEPITIGRSSACDIVLEDLSVSRKHAELHQAPSGKWRVRDLGSRNGVEVDSRSRPGWMVVEPDSVISIGDLNLKLESNQNIAADATDPQIDFPQDREGRTHRERPSSAAPRSVARRPRSRQGAAAGARGARTTGPARGPRNTSRPPYLLGAAVGLGAALALAIVVIVIGRAGSTDPVVPTDPMMQPTGFEEPIAQPSEPEPPAPSTSDDGMVNALLAMGRRASAEEKWGDAESHFKEVLASSPDHPEAQKLLEEATRERRSMGEIREAERAFNQGNLEEAELIAEGIHALSRYRSRADDLLDRIERGEGPASASPEIAKVEEPPPEKKTQKRPPPRRPRQPAKRPPRRPPAKTASSEPDPIVANAKRAFSEGRVSAARTAAEAASDAGVSGAAELSRQLSTFHRFSQTGDAARERGQIPAALANYTEALTAARGLSPPNGGTPGSELRRHLADLHYEAAQQSLQRDDPGQARRHLERALSFQSNHSQARSLLDSL